jgi:N-acetylglucosamine kinase-like BadF-type ATPase
VAIRTDGAIVAHARGPASNPQLFGWEESLRRLDALRGSLMRSAAVAEFRTTHVYLAGMDLPSELHAAWEELARWHPDVIDNDTFALLKAGTTAPTAVAVVCGTGVNAVGVRADGGRVRYPALGALSGDWGGGDGVGRAAVWHAARATDGRGPATALARSIPEKWGLASFSDFMQEVHFGRLDQTVYSAIAPLVFGEADAGDPVSGMLIDRLAEELTLLASTTVRRLEAEERAVPVIFGGGVIVAGNPRLIEGITTRLSRTAPNAVMSIVSEPPLLGAGIAALLDGGAGEVALTRYRREIAARQWPAAGA